MQEVWFGWPEAVGTVLTLFSLWACLGDMIPRRPLRTSFLRALCPCAVCVAARERVTEEGLLVPPVYYYTHPDKDNFTPPMPPEDLRAVAESPGRLRIELVDPLGGLLRVVDSDVLRS